MNDCQYENAIKSYKKMLENSWYLGDVKSEILAYEGISTSYYYMGELSISSYYKDRTMRGKVEKKDSQVRKIYLNALSCKLADKKKYTGHFLDLHKAEAIVEGKVHRSNSLSGPNDTTLSSSKALDKMDGSKGPTSYTNVVSTI
jgi:hypothetical protein